MNPKAFFKLSYGLYVVGSKMDGKLNCQIANTVFQVSSEPPTVAVAINKKNFTHEFISSSKVFSVSVLSQDTLLSFIGGFGFKSGREVDKLQGVSYRLGVTGAPIVLENTLAYFEAKVVNQMDCGTHTLFLGEVVEADVLREGEPMTYAYYHQVKRGSTPKTAPSYVEVKEAAPKMARYRCTVCNYVYDPEVGDPDGGIKPGTPFEQLPDSWVCPVCGASKDQFEKI